MHWLLMPDQLKPQRIRVRLQFCEGSPVYELLAKLSEAGRRELAKAAVVDYINCRLPQAAGAPGPPRPVGSGRQEITTPRIDDPDERQIHDTVSVEISSKRGSADARQRLPAASIIHAFKAMGQPSNR
jgi:hypothetical protein